MRATCPKRFAPWGSLGRAHDALLFGSPYADRSKMSRRRSPFSAVYLGWGYGGGVVGSGCVWGPMGLYHISTDSIEVRFSAYVGAIIRIRNLLAWARSESGANGGSTMKSGGCEGARTDVGRWEWGGYVIHGF